MRVPVFVSASSTPTLAWRTLTRSTSLTKSGSVTVALQKGNNAFLPCHKLFKTYVNRPYLRSTIPSRSTSSRVISSRYPEMSLLVPDNPLQQALDQYEHHEVHTGGPCKIPLPSLRIAGLSQPLALPLQPAQAESLIALAKPSPHGQEDRTVLDPAVRDSYELDPEQVEFLSPWDDAVQTVKNNAVEQLGIDPKSVESKFYKLLLYKKGGHFLPHTDTEKLDGMFATLVIQLPSDFRGGKSILRHHGHKAVYHGGADDASCIDTVYHTAFFADVEHELRPITYGYRIALVYNLVWSPEGPNLLPNQNSITPVTEALRDLTRNAPCNAWMLAMPLKHDYTMSSLEKFGIRSLKNHDASRVDALRLACQQINAGELEVVIGLLKSKGREQCSNEEGTFADKGYLILKESYTTDGSEFPYYLGFVNFRKAAEDWDLVLEKRSAPQYTGNEGALCETVYRTVVAFMWPRSKRLEVLSSSKWNLEDFLQEDSAEEGPPRIDRILDWYAATSAAGVNEETSADDVDEETFAEGLDEERADILLQGCQECSETHAPIAINLVRSHLANDEIRKPAIALILRFGWDCFANLLEDYLCPPQVETAKRTEGPLKMLHDLGNVVPQEVRVKSIEIMLTFLLKQQEIFERVPLRTYSFYMEEWEDEKKMTVEQFELILRSLVGARAEVDEKRKDRIDALLERTFQAWKESCEQFLTTLNEFMSDWNHEKYVNHEFNLQGKIKTELNSEAQKAQVARFRKDCPYVVAHLQPPPPKNAPENFADTWFGEKWNTSYESFIELAFRVMSREDRALDLFEMYKKFVSVIPNLCAKSIASIASTVEELQNSNNCEMPYLHGTVMYFKDKQDIQSLKEKELELVEATANEPPEARRVYADTTTGITEIDEFLRGQDMEMELKFDVVDDADRREKHETVSDALPPGSKCISWFGSDVLRIEIAKPSIETHETRLLYEENVKELEEVREKLKDLESRQRSLPDADVMESRAAQANTGDPNMIRKVYKM